MHRNGNRLRSAATLALAAGLSASAWAQVQHGVIEAVENNPLNDPNSVTLTRIGGAGPWTIVVKDVDPNGAVIDSSNRGDYTIDFGMGDDQNLGILMVGAATDLNVIVSPDPNGADDIYHVTHATARTGSGTGRYFIVTTRSPAGSEGNADVAMAYFPLADGWLAGGAYNSTNGGVITDFIGHPSIKLTNPFDPNFGLAPSMFVDNSDGQFGLRLDGVDMRRDGVLLACGAKNEDNFTQVFINADGDALLNNHDNGSNGQTSEQDPVAFVFVPEGTPGVVMGRISGSGRPIFGSGDFDVTLPGAPAVSGTFRLEIAGEDPTTGTLIVTPYNELAGNTIDNPAFVVPDATGWTITSRDIAGMGLQDIGAADCAFHFAFFPSDSAITPVGPTRPYLGRLDDVVSARFEVTEFTPDNGNGDMRADRVAGSDALGVFGDNRGDIGITWLNCRPQARIDNSRDAADGVWLGNPTEFFRDNSATGGVGGWSTLGFDNGEARTHNASDAGGEINSNFALAFFPQTAGFQQDADIQILSGATDTVQVGANDPQNDGVVVAINWDNNNRVVTAEPLAFDPNAGGSYLIRCFDADSGAASADWDYGYVFVPYSTPGIIAGQVDAGANVLSGSGFSAALSQGSDPNFALPFIAIEIPDVDARSDGVLVVTAHNGPYAMAWEPGQNGAFIVGALNTQTDFVERTAFSFAFVPYDPAAAGCPGDADGNNAVDLDDLLLLLGQFGGPGAADFDGDGTVDLDDLLILLGAFGSSCV